MARGRNKRSNEYGEFWPGYVDMLSTLLLVVTFMLSIFMLSQFFVGQEASGKDNALKRLTRQLAELTSLLSLEKGKGRSLEDEMAALQASIASLKSENEKFSTAAGLGDKGVTEAAQRISGLAKELADEKSVSNEALAKVDLLNQQLLSLRRQIAALNEALQAAEAKDKDAQARISDLGARLNVVLARQVQELQRYRSDFFGRLRELLKERRDIRVVGDRFVFQSEVLFPSGQALMTPEGLATSDALAAALVAGSPPADALGTSAAP